MSEIWVCHLAVESWNRSDLWKSFFEEAQGVLGTPLARLDTSDPVRRSVSSLEEAAEYVCDFGERESSRWLFGRFKKGGIAFSIRHHRQVDDWPNSFNWYFPPSFMEQPDSSRMLRALFDLGNRLLGTFYGYGDAQPEISRKASPFGAVDIEAELLGVFWITYFHPAYVKLIGREALTELHKVEFSDEGGATLVLGEQPSSLPLGIRRGIELSLARNLFVDPGPSQRKPRGEFALTFEQLGASPGSRQVCE